MKFSIIIPTCNSRSTLAAAVESALAQKYVEFEVLVSDNASTDGSREYLSSLSHPKLKVYLNDERLAKSDNWNRAFRQADHSDYLTMLHSDDVLYPDALKNLEATLRSVGRATLIFGNNDCLSVDGLKWRKKRMWPLGFVCDERAFRRLQYVTNVVSVVGVTFRRDAYVCSGGFDSRYDFAQDVMLYDKMAAIGAVAYCPAKLGLYRDTPSRPNSALRWATEQTEWMRAAEDIWWPRFFAVYWRRIHAAMQMEKLVSHASAERPSLLLHLTSIGIAPLRLSLCRRHSVTIVANLCKLFYFFLSCERKNDERVI